jgi:hypothetical protein
MKKFSLVCLVMVMVSGMTFADNSKLPRPDGKEADMSKPVQVYILMGQSNMLNMGKVKGLEASCKKKKLYPYLVDDSGAWTTRKDVRNVRIMASGNGDAKVQENAWLTVAGKAIGVEIGIGHHLGNAIDAPVMLLKSAIGNRSLGWDLLPPGSPRYSHDGSEVPGYREYSDGGKVFKFEKGVSKVISKKGRSRGKKVDPWYAGCQYDGDTRNAKEIVLANLAKYYPGATKYEIAGFFWWQGDKDFRNKAHAAKYEENLVNLIKALRKDFNAPKAKFVCATLGQTKKDATGTLGQILKAKFAVSDYSKYPAFKGNVATVYTNPLSMGSSSSAHYGGNAETYMNVGEGMGKAMVELLKK